MNPQYGYRQSSNGMNCRTGAGQGYGQGYRQGQGVPAVSMSTAQLNGARSRSAYGNTRAPPVFSSPSAGNFCGGASTGPQSSSWGGSSARPRQGIGRSNQYRSAVSKFQQCPTPQYRQQQPQQGRQQPAMMMNPQQNQLSSPSFCTPQAIKVNVTAEQLQNAKNTPIYQDRGEPSQSDNGNVKYIQLNWQDLLGGMENMQVSMVPNADPCNQNRQLKVSFGGQKTDPPAAGETKLKVISMQPAGTTDRMDMKDANAFAGTMRVCGTPTNVRMNPSPTTANNSYRQQGQSTQYSGRGTCRR